MNVLYLITMYGPDYLGNIIPRELGDEFQKRGHAFSVFAFANARELGIEGEETLEEGIAVHRALTAGRPLQDAVNALTKPFLKYERFASAWRQFARYLARHPEIELVLAEGAYPCGAIAALGNACRMIVTLAGGDFIASQEMNYGYGRYRLPRYLMRRALEHADAVRITTPPMRDAIGALGAHPKQIAVIPRNIASYCYAPADMSLHAFRANARQKLRERYGLGEAMLIVGVGRLLPIKGFELLIRSLPRVLEAVPDTSVLIAGPNRIDSRYGDYQLHLQRLTEELRVRERVIFTGAIPHPETREYLAAADLIAVPSVLEGMNKVVVEGAAVGTPSVVTRTTGIAGLMQDAGVGVIVEERSPKSFADALIALLTNPSHRTDLGKRGPEFARGFSSALIGAQLIDLCESVQEKRPSRPSSFQMPGSRGRLPPQQAAL
jgi:glycosyltransferase involved in cell wall biosynthesis